MGKPSAQGWTLCLVYFLMGFNNPSRERLRQFRLLTIGSPIHWVVAVGFVFGFVF